MHGLPRHLAMGGRADVVDGAAVGEGLLEEAERDCSEAIKLTRDIGDKLEEGASLRVLASVCYAKGESTAASVLVTTSCARPVYSVSSSRSWRRCWAIRPGARSSTAPTTTCAPRSTSQQRIGEWKERQPVEGAAGNQRQAGRHQGLERLGGAGAGQTAKMANQMCIAGVLGGLSEAIRLADAAGLDMDKTFEAISGGAAQSWQMENRWQTMVEGEFEFGFAVDWMRKDLAIALEEARHNGATLEMTELVDRFYAEVQQSGGSRWDTSSLIARLESASGKQ